MEIVDYDFVDRLIPVERAGAKSSLFSQKLLGMKVGEMMFVSRKEWKESGYRGPLRTQIASRKKRNGVPVPKWMAFEVKTFLEGWVIRRNEEEK